MTTKKALFLCLLLFTISLTYAQKNIDNFKWWNPVKSTFAVLEGQGWPTEVKDAYDRFPAKAEAIVRKPVWTLSRNAAGIKLRFRTNAKRIVIRYVVEKKRFAMDHFSVTGASGIDLYSLNQDRSWAWANGRYKFADTVTYEFTNLSLEDGGNYKEGREYHLYLPLYNIVSWMEIGVADKNSFTAMPVRKEKPIVIYGTSITQGACASRAGMAWTAILERELKYPIVNLGFSGNGKMEKEVVGLISEIDAKVFVLDCIPNLNEFTMDEIESRIINSVKTIRAKHSKTPILLTVQPGYVENRMDRARRKRLTEQNEAGERAYQKLLKDGIKDLYRLSSSTIGLGIDDTVDGSHPTDLGMTKYAKAHHKILFTILKNSK